MRLKQIRRNRKFMENPTNPTQSTKLYALLLKLRPLERGTLMPFSGELVHGAWHSWLRAAAPDVADRLHKGNKRRLFTCSGLQFPFTHEYIIQAQRENTHLPLDPQKTYTIRLTFLDGQLFPLLYTIIMGKNELTARVSPQPFMHIGKQSFLLKEVVVDADHASGWTGFTSCESLVENAKTKRFPLTQPLEMEFASLTAFNRIRHFDKPYGNHYARLPLPSYVFGGLAVRWQEIAPPALKHVIQYNSIQEYIETEGLIIGDYQLQTHHAHFVHSDQPGFVGTCRYILRGPDDLPTADEPLTVLQQIVLLSWLAFYTGVGYKPTMGMGQTRLLENR
jgi:CRISPR-associated endoribonuclease Cas6